MNRTGQHQNILISACLLGSPVRYNGTDLLVNHPLLKAWQQQGRLFPICPEVTGGLPTPRAPAEIIGREPIEVVNCHRQDVTQAFILGAKKTLAFAIRNSCSTAILTENSPSCGSHIIYDGSFSGTKVEGIGITTELLEQNNIRVFNQYQLTELQEYLGSMR